MSFKILLIAIGLCLICSASDDIIFNASVTHKFLFTDVGSSLVGGYLGQSDLPELQNKCNPWVGMFANFTVDFDKSNNSNYKMNGNDINVCFTAKNQQEFGVTTQLYVTDLLYDVDWPKSGAEGFNPEITNVTFYSSKNGFVTNFEENNAQWCIKGGF